MKIGARTTIFNFVMRERRVELGWSQEELADRCGFPVYFINMLESLRMPQNRLSTIIERLNKVAEVLELPFDQVFPEDYLDAIQKKKLPRRRTPILWCREIRIDELPPSLESLMLDSPEIELIQGETSNRLPEEVNALLDELPKSCRDVIKLRFGIGAENGKGLTLREVAEIYNVSIPRIRQIEEKALRLLRHPYRSSKVREFSARPA